MRKRAFTLEAVLFCLAIIVAASVRFIKLGTPALIDSEAGLGLQAMQSAGSFLQSNIVHPLYINVTGDLFWIFSNSNFTARFLPALAGTLLCVAPVLVKKRLGSTQAICLSFLLALEPSLVAASRQVGSAILSICCLTFAVIFILKKKSLIAGILTGISILTGPSIWPGWISVGLVGLISYLIELSRKQSKPDAVDSERKNVSEPSGRFNLPLFGLALAGSVLIFGSNFFTRPGNLSGLVGGLVEYFRGWVFHDANWVQSLKLILITTLVFGLFNIVFTTTGIIKGLLAKDRNARMFLFWFLILFIMIVLYPLHRVSDIAWYFLPLSFFTAITIPKVFQFDRQDLVIQISVSMVFFVLFIFAWLNAIWVLQNHLYPSDNLTAHAAAIIGALLLVVIIGLLIRWGWPGKLSQKSLLFSTTAVFIFFSLSMTRRAMSLGSSPEMMPYLASPAIASSDLLHQSIDDISLMNHGVSQTIDILVVGDASDSLIWSLRNYENVDYQKVISPGITPSLVITTSDTEPALTGSYRGQKFTWKNIPLWQQFIFWDWFQWIALQSGPIEEKEIYLWARNDLFPSTQISNLSQAF